MDTNDKGFIQLYGISSGYKVSRKILNAVLLSTYGTYLPHFGNSKRCEIMKGFVTSTVISKINASDLPCFLKNDENFPT